MPMQLPPTRPPVPIALLLVPLFFGVTIALVTRQPVFLIFVVLIPIISILNFVERRRRSLAHAPPSPPLERLGQALTEVARLTDELQAEVLERSELVSRLRSDSERYRALAALHKEEADAVAQSLRAGLRAGEVRSYVVNTGINIVVAGAAFVLGLVMHR